MGALAVPLAVGGGLLGAFGQYQEGREQAANLKTQAQMSARNAALLRGQASLARQQAGAEEEAQRRQAKQILGTQRAAVGQSGIGFGGTAGMLLEDSAVQAELDALNIRYGGELQASDLLSQASQSDIESQILKKNAKAAKKAGIMGAATSLLSAGAQAYGSGLLTRGTKSQGQKNALANNPAYVRNM